MYGFLVVVLLKYLYLYIIYEKRFNLLRIESNAYAIILAQKLVAVISRVEVWNNRSINKVLADCCPDCARWTGDMDGTLLLSGSFPTPLEIFSYE